MATKPSLKAEAWPIFDHIVADAAPDGVHTNPWIVADGQLHFEPDYETLQRLLGVPLHLKAGTQSGVPALALDVWLSYELRRAGFEQDQVWPRPTNPRILPASVAALIDSLPGKLKADVGSRVSRAGSITRVTAASAAILGKNYLKQVDVIITDWATGPELLISTKRMDSSYGKNAPNRVEESYGDAKNLRLRHPLAALGFVFGLRSDILTKEPRTADWLFDLLAKLGREDDAYHATCLILMEYGDEAALPDGGFEARQGGILDPGPESEDDDEDAPAVVPESAIVSVIKGLPQVTIRRDKIPPDLEPGRFLSAMVTRVLNTTPVNMHEEARRRRAST
ncbi:hypothetical protein [Phenylobacterium sp.]|uniref:hypothetical protein n=1 Tax=Phenylobacterium sp. TaxID=1871053 RepID=UPI0025FA18D4|nr:hypothetical protein [Phenylobacterium sp.]MBX3485965.1 hypothetical protein [Phenylobacterium sp.]MCW5758515.1 hypothetical protein [Phenylobacterium sp.]